MSTTGRCNYNSVSCINDTYRGWQGLVVMLHNDRMCLIKTCWRTESCLRTRNPSQWTTCLSKEGPSLKWFHSASYSRTMRADIMFTNWFLHAHFKSVMCLAAAVMNGRQSSPRWETDLLCLKKVFNRNPVSTATQTRTHERSNPLHQDEPGFNGHLQRKQTADGLMSWTESCIVPTGQQIKQPFLFMDIQWMQRYF